MAEDSRADQFKQGKERLDEMGRRLRDMFGGKANSADAGGIFSGLGSLLEQVGALVEQAEKSGAVVKKSGSFNLKSAPQAKGVYGFTVKTAMDDKVKVEPFGNIRRGDDGKLVAVHEVREPMVDVFDEPTRLLIVAEVPGVDPGNVQLEINGDILLISIENGEPKYRREVLLPGAYSAAQMSFHCRNGILEIQFLKK